MNTSSSHPQESTDTVQEGGVRYATTVPWCGIYGTVMPEIMDDALNSILSDSGTGMIVDQESVEAANDAMNWHAAHAALAKEYTEQWAKWLQLDVQFQSMWSPREYNFLTDVINATISETSLLKAFSDVDKAILAATAARRHTSYSGFTSFYDPNVETWGDDVRNWDEHQVGTLMCAVTEEKHMEDNPGDRFDQMAQYYLLEYPMCNGVIDNILYDNCPILEELVDKLREKEGSREKEGQEESQTQITEQLHFQF